MQDNVKIVVTMTQNQAEKLGIVYCACGHRPNNHFSHDEKPCAHCPCTGYEQWIVLPKDD